MNLKIVILTVVCLWSCGTPKNVYLIGAQSVTLLDTVRNRKIPIEIYSNANPIINLKNTKHDALRDIGSQELKKGITDKIIQFLNL